MRGRRTRVLHWSALLIGFAVVATATGARGAGRTGAPVRLPLGGAAERLGFAAEHVDKLATGRAAARPLDVAGEAELSAEGVVVLEAPIDEVVAAFQDLSILRRAGLTEKSGKFSATPTVSDMSALEVPASDVAELAKARVGNADIKLSGPEVAAVRGQTGSSLAESYKQALVRRVQAWQTHGIDGLGTYDDKKRKVCQKEATSKLLERIRAATRDASFEQVDAFQYWAVERIGDFKPLVQVSHVTVQRGPAGARIETIQLYASHYCEALVTSIDLVPIQTVAGEATMMRLTFRAQMDSMGGLLGGLKRRIGRSRVVEHVAEGLERIRGAVN
jgi:hypothetical protein